jgi:hypothetical protein
LLLFFLFLSFFFLFALFLFIFLSFFSTALGSPAHVAGRWAPRRNSGFYRAASPSVLKRRAGKPLAPDSVLGMWTVEGFLNRGRLQGLPAVRRFSGKLPARAGPPPSRPTVLFSPNIHRRRAGTAGFTHLGGEFSSSSILTGTREGGVGFETCRWESRCEASPRQCAFTVAWSRLEEWRP